MFEFDIRKLIALSVAIGALLGITAVYFLFPGAKHDLDALVVPAAVDVQGRLSVTMHDVTLDGDKTFHAYELKWGENYYAVLVVETPAGKMGMTVLK